MHIAAECLFVLKDDKEDTTSQLLQDIIQFLLRSSRRTESFYNLASEVLKSYSFFIFDSEEWEESTQCLLGVFDEWHSTEAKRRTIFSLLHSIAYEEYLQLYRMAAQLELDEQRKCLLAYITASDETALSVTVTPCVMGSQSRSWLTW